MIIPRFLIFLLFFTVSVFFQFLLLCITVALDIICIPCFVVLIFFNSFDLMKNLFIVWLNLILLLFLLLILYLNYWLRFLIFGQIEVAWTIFYWGWLFFINFYVLALLARLLFFLCQAVPIETGARVFIVIVIFFLFHIVIRFRNHALC